MSHSVDTVVRTEAPTFGALVNTEFWRLRARRFTKMLLGIAVIGYLIAIAFIWTTHSKVTPADIAQATAQRDQQIAGYAQSVADCLKQPGVSADQCGSAPTAAEFPIDQFLQHQPFQPRVVGNYSMAVGVAVAMAAFVLAATSIGAEWSSKNLVAWLFYEPRRMRLMGAKILTLLASVLVLSVIAQLVWAVTARLLISARGIPVSSLPKDEAATFWTDILQLQIRAGLLVIPAALLGFALASLLRNTAAALGIAFVFFAIVETVLGSISPALQPYQFTTSALAWVMKDGFTVYGSQVYDRATSSVISQEIHVSNLHGGTTMLVYAVVAMAAALLLFRRRDIT